MREKKTIEVLAPAGGAEALRAAVFSGCDAVYLGGPAFGARANAKNFSREQLAESVEFCHERGVHVHVTVNTLLKDEELLPALEFVRFLCGIAVDAVLIQDMGLFDLVRRAAPELPVHASTQMSLHTPGGARLLWELGAARVVLSRELSLEEIREIGEGCPVELEAFVHGALCMSVSGQCYFSAMLGGRSGNRGLCAQPCRLPFAASGGTGHDLSLKDVCFLPRLQELSRAGVCSGKIEGRMKRPEYVGAAVSACRRAADGEPIDPQLLEDLEAVFSRSGFTQGYLDGKRGRGMFGIRTKEDVAGATEKVFSRLRSLYRSEARRVGVALSARVREGRVILRGEDAQGRIGEAQAPWEPERTPLSSQRCVEQLQKTGGTPFYPGEIQVPQEGLPLGVSGLNALRRQCLEELLRRRGERRPIEMREVSLDFPAHEKRSGKLPLWLSFSSIDQLFSEASSCKAIVLPLATPADELKKLGRQGFSNVILEIPRAMFGRERELREKMRQQMQAGFSQFSCGNLGAIQLGRELGARLYGGFGLNIFNTASLEFFEKLGLEAAELSFELTGREISALSGALPRGVMIYGRQALMLTRNCPLANGPKGCAGCSSQGELTDRMGKKFPVTCGGERKGSQVLNSLPLWISPGEPGLESVDFGVARFTVENAVECESVFRALTQGTSPDFSCTRGLYRRGVE